jgi:hypothetical protein
MHQTATTYANPDEASVIVQQKQSAWVRAVQPVTSCHNR